LIWEKITHSFLNFGICICGKHPNFVYSNEFEKRESEILPTIQFLGLKRCAFLHPLEFKNEGVGALSNQKMGMSAVFMACQVDCYQKGAF